MHVFSFHPWFSLLCWKGAYHEIDSHGLQSKSDGLQFNTRRLTNMDVEKDLWEEDVFSTDRVVSTSSESKCSNGLQPKSDGLRLIKTLTAYNVLWAAGSHHSHSLAGPWVWAPSEKQLAPTLPRHHGV